MIGDKENIGFIYLLQVKLMLTFSRISKVVFSTLGKFPKTCHIIILHSMCRDRKSLLFQWSLTCREAGIDS